MIKNKVEMAGIDPDLVWSNILNATGDFELNDETIFLLESEQTSPIYIAEPESMIDPFHSNQYFVTIILTHAITFIVGVIGNSVVISTWARGGKIRSPTTTFLVSLACADLLLLIIFMPLETAEYFVITWDKHGYICKLSSFVELLSGMASILNLVAVSVERYLVIVYPIQARRWCTVTKSRRSLLFVWILAIILAAPPVFNKSTYSITYYNQETEITAYYCFEQNGTWAVTFAIYELMLLFVIPATLMVLCYSRVIRELWTSTRVISVLTSNNTASSASHRNPHPPAGFSTSNSSAKTPKSYLVRWHQNQNQHHQQQPQQNQHQNQHNTDKGIYHQSEQRRPISIAVNYHEATDIPLPTATSSSTSNSERKTPVRPYSSMSPNNAGADKCTLKNTDNDPNQHSTSDGQSVMPPDSAIIVNGAYHQYSLTKAAGLTAPSITKLFKPDSRNNGTTMIEHPRPSESSTTSTENVPTIAIGPYYRERSNSLNFLLKTCSQVYRYIQCCLCCLICCLTWNRKPAQPEVVTMHRSVNYSQHPGSLISFNTMSLNNTSNTVQNVHPHSPNQQQSQQHQLHPQTTVINRHLMPPSTPTSSHLTVRSFPNLHSNTNSSSTNVYQHSINGSFKASVTDVRHARKQLYCQVIKMLLLIVILFLVCWGPRLIFNVIKSAGFEEFSKNAYSARVYFYLLSFIHSALNPFVYGFMSSNFRIIFFRRHRHRAKCADGLQNIPANHSSIPSINDKLPPERVSPNYSLNDIPRPNSNISNPISHHSVNENWKQESSTSSLREIESEIEHAVQVDREQHRARRYKRSKPKRTQSVQTNSVGVTVGSIGVIGSTPGGAIARIYKRPFLHKYLHRRSASLFLFPNRKHQQQQHNHIVIGHNNDRMTQSDGTSIEDQHTAHSF